MTRDVRQIYHLAADRALGRLTANRARIVSNNTVIDIYILGAARLNNVKRLLFTSSSLPMRSLREDDAWPADPEEGQGVQKLYTEKLCQYYAEDCGLEARVARFHDVPAICWKIALADDGGVIDVWGDGKQTRSSMYVDDCVEGLHRLMCSDCPIPVNFDTRQSVAVDDLARVVAGIAGKAVRIRHNRSMPQGVRGCNSDSALSRYILKWEPKVSLAEGLARTYAWIAQQLAKRGASIYGQTVAPASAKGRLREPIVTAA